MIKKIVFFGIVILLLVALILGVTFLHNKSGGENEDGVVPQETKSDEVEIEKIVEKNKEKEIELDIDVTKVKRSEFPIVTKVEEESEE